MAEIKWGDEVAPILITGSKKTGKVTAISGDLKIIANAKLTRKQREKYVKLSVSKLDMSDFGKEDSTVKLKDGYEMTDLMTNQLEMDTVLELALYDKVFNGKTSIEVSEDFLENDSLFLELREELLIVLKEHNGLGKSESQKQEKDSGMGESVEG